MNLHSLMQLDIFTAPPPFVRQSDTSKQAAEAIKPQAPTLREQVFNAIRQRGSYGATDEELQDVLRMNPSTQRPRRVELAKAGRITTATTRKTKSGRAADVWVTV